MRIQENFPGLFSLFAQEKIAEQPLDPPHAGIDTWAHTLRTAGAFIIRSEGETYAYTPPQLANSSIASVTVARTISPGSGEAIFYPLQIDKIRQ